MRNIMINNHDQVARANRKAGLNWEKGLRGVGRKVRFFKTEVPQDV